MCQDALDLDVEQPMQKLPFVLVALVVFVMSAMASGKQYRTSVEALANSEFVETRSLSHVPTDFGTSAGGHSHSEPHHASVDLNKSSHSTHPKSCDPLGGNACSSAFVLIEGAHWNPEARFGSKQIATRQFRLDDEDLDTRYRPPIADS